MLGLLGTRAKFFIYAKIFVQKKFSNNNPRRCKIVRAYKSSTEKKKNTRTSKSNNLILSSSFWNADTDHSANFKYKEHVMMS